MDCITDPDVEEVVLLWASQTAKTTIFNTAVGYYIAHDPSPIMMVQPTKEMGEAWSKDRFVPMVRDTPVLHDLVNVQSSRDGENTIMHKRFPGGSLTIAGANSPASLASRPKRVMILDEVDRFPLSAKKEGRPSKLAIARTTTFLNRKILKSSSPTIKGESEIEEAFEQSDRRFLWVECPHCREKQKMAFEQLQWPQDEPEKAVYVCSENGCIMTDADKHYLLAHHEWRAEAPFRGRAGFRLSALYSPWLRFGEIAKEFVESKGDPEKLKVFINTRLAETYEENLDGEGIEEEILSNRVEDYDAAPAGVLVVTIGVDVQDDRLELEVIGWGKGEESWTLAYHVLPGDPGTKEVWEDLDDIYESLVPHEIYAPLKVRCMCIDAGGHHAEQVYNYVKMKQRQRRRVYWIRGASQPWRPIVGKLVTNDPKRGRGFFVGTDTAKDSIFSRFKIEEPGEGYCHFKADLPDSYFEGLTAEKLVKRYAKGRSIRQYVKKSASARNEPLDCRVYGYAALKAVKTNYDRIAMRLEKTPQKNPPPDTLQNQHNADEKRKKAPAKRAKRSGFVNRW